MKGKTHGSPFTVRQPPIEVDIADAVCSGNGVVEGALGVVIGNVDVVCKVVVSFSMTSILG